MFLILFFLFGFNLFSLSDWSKLLNARLHGFAGFVFGLLILSALPIYMATTILIIRTNKPLFSLSAPKDEDNKEQDEEQKEPDVQPVILSPEIPTELKAAFFRAKKNIGNMPESAFNAKDKTIYSEADQSPSVPPQSALPLPDSFDFSSSESSDSAFPVFKEIKFSEQSANSGEPDAAAAKPGSPLTEYLEKNKREFSIDGNIVITKGMAVAAHFDPDFWIADSESWFAAGKQKTSPISEALAAAEKHNAAPAIYLAEKNIMDLDSCISEWESKGVKIIRDLSELD
jgi:hypothetical protein